jgi:hypothetical protein
MKTEGWATTVHPVIGYGIQDSNESHHLNKATEADSYSNPPNRPSSRLF